MKENDQMNSKPTHQQQSPPSEKPSIALAYVVYLAIFLVAICWSAYRLVSFVPERQHLGDDEAAIQHHHHQQHQQVPDEHTSLLSYSRYNSTGDQDPEQGNRNMANGYNHTGPGSVKPADVRDEHHGTGLIQVRTLDPALLPGDITTTGQQSTKRLVIIGDVHGCRASLEALLDKVAFLPENDHLIFVGDMINKGPDSVGVVELARKYGASAVRGNHEDRILKLRREMDLDGGSGDEDEDESDGDSESSDEGSGVDEVDDDYYGTDDQDSGNQSDFGKKSMKEKKEKKKDKKDKKEKKEKKEKKDKKDKKAKKKDKKDKKKHSDEDNDDKKKNKKDKKDKKGKKGKKDKKSKKGNNKDKGKGTEKEARERALAALLPKDQVQWLESCPVVLRLGPIRGMGEVVVVHGGLVPGIELERQHPDHVMTMRSIDEKDKNTVLDSPKGTMWAKLFNNHQSKTYSSVQKTDADPMSKTMTVVYGHDARSGLAIEKHTKGLDSGCVKGNQLTALVIEEGGKQSLVHVKCQDDVEKE